MFLTFVQIKTIISFILWSRENQYVTYHLVTSIQLCHLPFGHMSTIMSLTIWSQNVNIIMSHTIWSQNVNTIISHTIWSQNVNSIMSHTIWSQNVNTIMSLTIGNITNMNIIVPLLL